MKRLLLGMMVVCGAGLLGGCPIYSDDSSYRYNQCQIASDCGYGYGCSQQGQCVPDPTYQNDASTDGVCGSCATGTVCTLFGGVPQCLPPNGFDATVPFVDAGAESDRTVDDVARPLSDGARDDGNAFDGSPEASTGGALCNLDSQCTVGVGSRCIDGLCTAQSHLCSDGTQCLVAGESCVDGICLPPCGSGAPPCPAGYACDFPRGVCSVNPSACTTAAECQGGAVCVEARCVAPCAAADSGAQCTSGQVCVNGGCIPDQQARFTCQNDGNQGALANSCEPSSICLHGDCYPACDAEGGGCAAEGQSCKSVRIPKGTYAVCASSMSLGSDCNPAVGNFCSSPKVCIDGYCK